MSLKRCADNEAISPRPEVIPRQSQPAVNTSSESKVRGKFKKGVFLAKGYTIVRNLFNPEQVARFQEAAKKSLPDQSLRAQYNQKNDPFRYEYMLTLSKDDLASVYDYAIRPLSSRLELSQTFAIVSEPGSKDQPWHTDSIPGPGSGISDGEWRNVLHYVGVLSPLVETNDECGKTEAKIASHKTPGATEFCKTASVSLHPGDALILDGRTLHRGMKNGSADTVRTMCFFTYKFRDFQDGNATAYTGNRLDT